MTVFDNTTALMAKIAWLYYIQGWTQDEIAGRFGFSRPTVTRHLAKARELGIVEIRVSSQYRMCFEVEEELKRRFSLHDAIVVPAGNSPAETKSGVGKACAAYLDDNLEDGDILGIAWGSTIYETGKHLRLKKPRNITVVQLMGGLNTSEKLNPEEIVKSIAAQLEATGVWLNTPAIVGSPEIKRALLSDEGVKSVLAKAKTCTKGLLGIGAATDDASLIMSNVLTLEDMHSMRQLGAVGDIVGWFFDASGAPVNSYISDRIISVPLEDIKSIPMRIVVASGLEKAAPLLSAIRGGYINVLVTDEDTALEVLARQANS